MILQIETEQEIDGRWIAEVLGLPGVMASGATVETAIAIAQAFALRVLGDRLEHGEAGSELMQISFQAA